MNDLLQCEHCLHHSLKCTDEDGIDEHCDYCGLSIFLSPEELIIDLKNDNDDN